MSPDEMYLAGYRLEFSGSVTDLPEIERLYRRAAAAGSVEAMARVGLLVEGRTRARFEKHPPDGDLAEAAEWYRRGAYHGDAKAAFFLGRLYAEKLGDRAAAEPWYRQAAHAGHGEARKLLAEDRRRTENPAVKAGCVVLPVLLVLVVLVAYLA